MRKISLAGFKDPVRRPRYIVWTGVFVLALIPLMIVGVNFASTRWFCGNVCHKVQDDLMAAYRSGSHSQISCMACHEPVNADPATFMMLKSTALLEVYQAVSNTYKFPLNAGSALAMNAEEMGAGQCTQCHSANRMVSPSPGILIDHKAHADKGVWCTVCHNRVAHPEQTISLTLSDGSGTPNAKHPVFTKMTACFRCHDIEGKKEAPGKCSTCHPPGFQLKPPSHLDSGFFPKGHAELAREELKKVEEGKAEAEKLIEEGVEKRLAEPVFYCATCHVVDTFCKGCHGLDMPHTAEFKGKTHKDVAKASLALCLKCHDRVKRSKTPRITEVAFCENCHHKHDPSSRVTWIKYHQNVVKKTDPQETCYKCHDPVFCESCHVRRRP